MSDHHSPESGISRRKMLKNSLFGAATSWTIPTFLYETLAGLDAHAGSTSPGGNDGPITVIIQLSGGNDGLNTVVPYNGHSQRSVYEAERPNLKILEESVLPLDAITGGGTEQGTLGLNPKLGFLQQLWNQEELAIVNGVGYPNPNLSHFTSFDFWHTAQPNEQINDGWWGRYFDHQCDGNGNCSPSLGVNVHSQSHLAFKGDSNLGLSLPDPGKFGWVDPESDETRQMESAFRKMTGVDHPYQSGIDPVKSSLAYVQRSISNAMISSRTIEQALANGAGSFPVSSPANGGFPDTTQPRTLMDDLHKISRMIHSGMDTCIYYAHQGGYDTHSDQYGTNENSQPDPLTGRHAYLMEELNAAISAFVTEMKAQGNWDRVLLFTFSEFGRKVHQNGSQGTDHGAGSNLFVTGGGVKAGMYGITPSLATGDRVKNHSLDFNIDFRRVYRTVLQNWMNVPEGNIGDILPSAPPNGFTPVPFI